MNNFKRENMKGIYVQSFVLHIISTITLQCGELNIAVKLHNSNKLLAVTSIWVGCIFAQPGVDSTKPFRAEIYGQNPIWSNSSLSSLNSL
jgi:hypothetical protein